MDGIAVWATGNQHLRAEAGIPGLRNAISIYENLYDADVYEAYDRPSPETYKFYRREGLRLVQDLYQSQFPQSDMAFIIVDDEPMGDLETEGWSYYAPWDFVEAIENGAVDGITIPEDVGGISGAPAQSGDSDISHPPLDELQPLVT